MKVRVKIPNAIVDEAKARGVRVKEHVEEVLSRHIENVGSEGERPRSAEEIRAWLDSLSQFTEKIPPLPETITRDWIYPEHK